MMSSKVLRIGKGSAHFLEQRRGLQIAVGKGGRSSVAGLTATVFGCTGFLGRYVVNKLGRVGTQVIVPYRGDDESTRHLKVMGDLGQIIPVNFRPRDPKTIIEAVRHSDVVINLVGKQELTRNFDLFGANVEVVGNIARACKEAGVPKLIHVSAMLADELSPSDWLRRKAQGEAVVLEVYPDATILRPSIMFGDEDRFINLAAKWIKLFGVAPLVGSGSNKIQPVYVDNVAEAIRACVFQDQHDGKVFELAGPEPYTLRDLLEFVKHSIGEDDARVRQVVPDMTGWLPEGAEEYSPHVWGAKLLDALYRIYPQAAPGAPQLLGVRGDSAMMYALDWVPKPREFPQLDAFGIRPADVKAVSLESMHRYRRGGHFVNIKQERHIPL